LSIATNTFAAPVGGHHGKVLVREEPVRGGDDAAAAQKLQQRVDRHVQKRRQVGEPEAHRVGDGGHLVGT
jgi:hypothetical protein